MPRTKSARPAPVARTKASRGAADDDAAAKNKPLVEDIRLLGRILGDVIREQEGTAAFELIERIRQLSVAYRLKADASAGRVLDRLLKNLSADQTVSVIRAFSYFSHLANIAEDRHHVRRRAVHERNGDLQEGSLAMADELGDRPFGVEDALALHLGRVGGEHGRDVGVLQSARDVGGAVVGLVQALEGHRQRAFLVLARTFMHRAAAHVVLVFGDVGQMAEVAEGADHAHRLVAGKVLQQPVEHPSGAGIGLQPVGHRKLAHALDQLEGFLAFLLADHVAKDAAEHADVFDQRAIFLRGVSA